jgi:hypothetical protein
VGSVTGDAGGNLYTATYAPDYMIQVDLSLAQVSVVGNGTSGYNSTTDPDFGICCCPATRSRSTSLAGSRST